MDPMDVDRAAVASVETTHVEPVANDLWRRAFRIWAPLAAPTLALQAACLLATPCLDLSMWEHYLYILAMPWAGMAVLGCVLDHRGRFRQHLSLHLWTRRWAICNAGYVAASLVTIVVDCHQMELRRPALMLQMLLLVTCNLINLAVVIMKLTDLGHLATANVCTLLLVAAAVTAMVWAVCGYLLEDNRRNWRLLAGPLACFLAFHVVAIAGMVAAARSAQLRFQDPKVPLRAREKRTLRLSYLFLYLTAVLSGISSLTFASLGLVFLFHHEHFLLMKTLDELVACVQALLLSGLVGPNRLTTLARHCTEVVGSLQVSSRINYPGKIKDRAERCIASFPGKEAEEWKRVTREQEQKHDASVACVFLTDTWHGLAKHPRNPEDPEGRCFCASIYPPFSEENYLRVWRGSQRPIDRGAEQLDANAMGQQLFVESDYYPQIRPLAWRLATWRARRACIRNKGRAPWGCEWYKEWRVNVDLAVEKGQELLVFFMRGKVGQGTLEWEALTDRERVQEASQKGGLGNSQRVEEAYLKRQGYRYSSCDVAALSDTLHWRGASKSSSPE